MAVILIVEDDPGTLRLLKVTLLRQGHDVLECNDGEEAWASIRSTRPDLVISDIGMPGMNGYELLSRIRHDTEVALTPVILLTSLQQRQSMRHGMSLGADDYLTKPFQRQELIDAVDAQLEKQALRAAAQDRHIRARLDDALQTQAEDYEARLASELNQQWPGASSDLAQADIPAVEGYVLCAGILEHDRWSALLPPPDWARLLKRFHESCGDTIHLFNASHMQFGGEAVVALYADPEHPPDDDAQAVVTSPGLRAVKAALGLRRSVAALRSFIERQFPGQGLPLFDIGMSLHSGPVGLVRLEGLIGGSVQTVPVGQTVTDALAIQRHAEGSGTPITITATALRDVSGAVRAVQRYQLPLPHLAQPMDVCRVEAPIG